MNFNKGILPISIRTIELPKVKQQEIKASIDEKETERSFKFGNAQHIGSRKDQEDSFGYSNILDTEEISKRGALAVLADGMGGLSHGKLISEYVVSSMLLMYTKINLEAYIPEQLENIAININDEISREFSQSGKSSAGSTLVALLIHKLKLYWVSVGDSRIYVFRRGSLYQLNEDHDYLNQLLIECAELDSSLEEAKNNPQKDALTSYIGSPNNLKVDFNKRGFAIQRGDKFILCSDGVYNPLNNASLIDCLYDEPQIAAENVIKAILNKNISDQDNMSVMIIEYI